jgi:hypothetical protein
MEVKVLVIAAIVATLGLTAITSAPQFHILVFPWNAEFQKVKYCQDKGFWPLQKTLTGNMFISVKYGNMASRTRLSTGVVA